ncbi:MAG: HAMP domain-containing histidine kinase [Anaerolineae bacterium]|nr:HAMP domain-containing histidine kinase [Anaerolineae bacterium]
MTNPFPDPDTGPAGANRQTESISQAQSQFMAMISHELRTPLNAIIGFTQLLLEELYGPITDKQRDRMTTILNNAESLLDLINGVLDLSKIESGSMELNPMPIDVSEVAREVLTNHEVKATQKDLILTLNDDDVSPIIADRGHLTRMLNNLVDNAIKFTKSGGVTVKIGHLPEQQMVSIAVTDTGIGIPDDALNKIFEAFKQVDSSTTREFGGMGLGLAITQQLVALHGGHITVESAVGDGSTFTIYLPVAAAGS